MNSVPNSKKSIVVVEDNPLERQRLVSLIRGEPGYDCAASFGNGQEFLSFHKTLKIDALILDLELDGMNGLDCLKQLLVDGHPYPVMVVTQFEDPKMFYKAIEYGAHGYHVKPISSTVLFEGLSSLLRGEVRISSSVAYLLKKRFEEMNRGNKDHFILSERQKEVLIHISKGLTDKEVATTLGITQKTVETHVGNIIQKLHARNRTHAVAIGINHDLIGD